MRSSNKIRAVFGAGFAVLLGLGIAAVVQTFVWETSVTLVAGAYEMLNRMDRIAYSAEAAEAAALRFASTSDIVAADECRQDLSVTRELMATMSVTSSDGPAFRSLKASLSALLDRQNSSLRSALESAAPGGMAQAMVDRDVSGARTELRTAVQNLHNELRQTLDQRIAYQAATAHRARRLFLTSGLMCCMLIFIAGWQVSVDLSRREIFGRQGALRSQQYRQAVELAADMVFRLDDKGRFTYCNPIALQTLHYSEQELIGRGYDKLVRLDMRREVERFYLRQAARARRSSYHEFPILDGHGRERWVGLNAQVLTDGDRLVGFQAIARDISERKRVDTELAEKHTFLTGMAANTPGILYVFDLVDRKTLFANREVGVVLGYKPEENTDFDQMVMRLVHPDDLSALRLHQESLRRARSGDSHRIEYRARHADGNWMWLSAWESPLTWDEDGRVRQIVGIAQDVTAHNTARERLTWQANYDTLTRLANRQHFWTRLQNLLRRASMDNTPVTLCLFDIDLFKEVNDRFGHAAGDEVLEAIGTIVRSELRSDDVSGRLGGDEFCFVLPNIEQDDAAQLAERIRERLNTMAFGMNGGSPFTASATFGVAAWQSHMSARELMEAADRALYRAKASGRNRVCIDA